jgi:hypothetical protein
MSPSTHRFLLFCLLPLALSIPASTNRAAAASLLPLQTENAATLPNGDAELVLGLSYDRNLRFPPFTPDGVIDSQHLIRGPQIALRAAAGSWAEVQASFEAIYLDERRTSAPSRHEFGHGDARLFTKVRVVEEGGWWPGLGVRFGTKLPNANADRGLGTDQIDFLLDFLGSRDFGVVSGHVNLGVYLLGNPGPVPGAPDRSTAGQDDVLSYAVAVVSQPLAGAEGGAAIRLLGEVVGLAGSRFDNDRLSGRIGIQVRQGSLTGYGGFHAGMVQQSEDYGGSVGLIYHFDFNGILPWRD